MQSLARVRFTHVPYKSATLATGALSGDVDMVIVVVSSAVPFMNAGKMRGIAILDTRRNASAPEVPTSVEAGMPEPSRSTGTRCSRLPVHRAPSSSA